MILVFGKTGQVAQALSQFDQVICLGRDDVDLTNLDACRDAILSCDVKAVINAAAYTAVDNAENDEVLAAVINEVAPAAMAEACAQKNIPFVHFSTDYVFNGTGELAWHPQDDPEPLNAYGRTKLQGEQAIIESGCIFAIIRTSWVFSAKGKNFLNSMLHLSETRDTLNVINDQHGGPTSASALAEASIIVAEALQTSPEKAGIYHLSGTPDTSWYDFAQHIFDVFDKKLILHPIPTKDYPSAATRPLNSRLDCSTLYDVFGIERPNWRDDVDRIRWKK